VCASCGKPAADWAYVHGCADELIGPDFTGNPAIYCEHISEHYLPLCKSCHKIKDGPVRGEAHHATTLTDVEVATIRVRYAAGGVSQRVLAAEYGVHQGTIWRIIHHIVRNNY
jgi:hypothetical protein